MTSGFPWVVTGGAGFLGSHVVEQLVNRGTPVIVVDDLSIGHIEYIRGHLGNKNFTFVNQDIRQEEDLKSLFLECRAAAVVHLAALHFIPWCMSSPSRCISINVYGTQCVLSAAHAAGVDRVWFASTGDVYAPDKHPHQEENSALGPFNIYGLSKLIGEQLVGLAFRERQSGRFVIGRLFNLFGPRETNPHILPEILLQLRTNPSGPLRLGSLWPKRDFVPVAEAARVVIESLEAAPVGSTTVNVGTGEAVSMQEILDRIGEVLGHKLQIETDETKIRPVERGHLQADVSRLRAMIGFVPQANLRRRVEELLGEENLIDG